MYGAKNNILETIGDTPIVKLNRITAAGAELYVKLENLNTYGSTKDRIATYILDCALALGELKPGGSVVECTSGNTGVGIAAWCLINGFKCTLTIADKQSSEKIAKLKSFGARVEVCPSDVAPDDPRSYYSTARRIAAETEGSYYVDQYNNPLNSEAHYNRTGPEIWKQTNGDFDVFVCAVGTGGTASGCGRYFKEQNPRVKLVGVDCEGSIIASYAATGSSAGAHTYLLEGIGEDFVPSNVDYPLFDNFEVVGDQDSFRMARRLLSSEGIYAGGSSGSTVAGAVRYAKRMVTRHRTQPLKVLALLHDAGDRYMSKMYSDEWMLAHGFEL